MKKSRASTTTKVRGSRTGRPIMVLLDLLGRRWMLRVVWELREIPATFRELRERCDGVSPTLLNDRLKELRAFGVVDANDETGYALTDMGRELLRAFEPLLGFATKHAAPLKRGLDAMTDKK